MLTQENKNSLIKNQNTLIPRYLKSNCFQTRLANVSTERKGSGGQMAKRMMAQGMCRTHHVFILYLPLLFNSFSSYLSVSFFIHKMKKCLRC